MGLTIITTDEAAVSPDAVRRIKAAIHRRLYASAQEIVATRWFLDRPQAALPPAPETPPQLPIRDLLFARQELMRHGALLWAIWFVDRPLDYHACRSWWLDRDPHALAWPRLVDWRRITQKPEDWTRAPLFACIPGIWLEMSDGNHGYILTAPDGTLREGP